MPIEVETQPGVFEEFQAPQGPQPDLVKPDFLEAAGETFKSLNPVASAIRHSEFVDEIEGIDENLQGPPDPDFNLAEHIPVEHSAFTDFYVDYADTPQEAAVARDYIDSLLESQRVMAESGPWGYAAGSIGSILADPTIIIPGTAAFKAVRFANRLHKFGAVAGASTLLGAGSVGLSEEILLRTQPTKSREESARTVMAAGLLSFILGPVVARNISPEVQKIAEHELRGNLRSVEGKKYVLDAETGTIELNTKSERNKAQFTKEELENC